MSQADIRRLAGGPRVAFGRQWYYKYSVIPEHVDEAHALAFVQSIERLVGSQCAQWNDAKTSEWCVRNYSAARLILGSTILARSIEYAASHNLWMLLPHGAYYLALSALRTMIITSPRSADITLKSALEMSHRKTINVAVSILRQIDSKLGIRIHTAVRELKATRELIDYRAPTSGAPLNDERTMSHAEIAGIALEIAQLQTEIRQRALEKRAIRHAPILEEHRCAAIEHVIEGIHFKDADDAYRVDYLHRKHGFPVNLFHMISEGHVDDVMNAWGRQDGGATNQFDPDDRIVNVFDLP